MYMSKCLPTYFEEGEATSLPPFFENVIAIFFWLFFVCVRVCFPYGRYYQLSFIPNKTLAYFPGLNRLLQ